MLGLERQTLGSQTWVCISSPRLLPRKGGSHPWWLSPLSSHHDSVPEGISHPPIHGPDIQEKAPGAWNPKNKVQVRSLPLPSWVASVYLRVKWGYQFLSWLPCSVDPNKTIPKVLYGPWRILLRLSSPKVALGDGNGTGPSARDFMCPFHRPMKWYYCSSHFTADKLRLRDTMWLFQSYTGSHFQPNLPPKSSTFRVVPEVFPKAQ